MKPHRLLPAPILLLAGACIDYDLKNGNDALGVDTEALAVPEDTDPPPPEVDACEAFGDLPAEPIAQNDECDLDLQTGSFTPVVEWSYGDTSFCGPAAVGQLADTDGSGDLDGADLPLLVMYEEGDVVALYGDGSGVAWRAVGDYGQNGGFALGDVDGDGWPDVVTAATEEVCVLRGTDGARIWCTGGLRSTMDPYGYNYPAVADMDGDGVAEVTIGDVILHGPSGALLARGGRGRGAAPYGGDERNGTYGVISVPVDLDADGEMELVTGNTAYTIDGAIKWTNTGDDGLVAVADFDGDGQGEIVKTTGNAIVGMETGGQEIWGPIEYGTSRQPANLGAPAIDDLDGDGVPEIIFAARDELIAMEWGGAVIWKATIEDQSGAAGPVLFDFEMDGYPEVLYADETSIRFFSGVDGTAKYYSPEHVSYTILETPIVADVDGDDQVEIVLGHCGDGRPTSMGGVTVFGDADESWPPGRKIWNQHAYSITNIEELGQIPGPVPNWGEYNSFRSADIGLPPSEFWDLRAQVLDVCEDECEQGLVYVAARVNNAGNIDVPAGVSVTLRAGAGGPVLAEAVTSAPIPAGTTGEVLRFEVAAEDIAGQPPVITADEDSAGTSTFYECDETNNIDAWLDPACE